MSCCGSKRQQVVSNASALSATSAVATPSISHGPGSVGALFVYDGVAGLIITGRATGRRYRFGERGARLSVDVRDAPALATIPKLRRVSA
jgi:hypothetical protein